MSKMTEAKQKAIHDLIDIVISVSKGQDEHHNRDRFNAFFTFSGHVDWVTVYYTNAFSDEVNYVLRGLPLVDPDFVNKSIVGAMTLMNAAADDEKRNK